MAASSSSEPFPLLSTSTAGDQLHSGVADHGSSARRRRKSSAILEEVSGDTGTPALATSLAHLSAAHRSHHVKDPKDAASPAPSKRFSKRRKARSVLRRARHFAARHTWVLPLGVLLVVLSLYVANPTASNPVYHLIFLSYRTPPPPGSPAGTPAQYGKGPWDMALVGFYIVVLSFTREFVMQELLRPLARFAGLRSRSKQARFMEQMYAALYFGTLGPAGMWVMSRTPVWYFDTAGMYAGFPHRTHAAEFKFYYLFQAAFWAQQAVVLLLGMEKRRKDFRELVGHHIVSLALIALSYRFHFTHMGLAVYITHDISDFFLATSKTLNYLDHPAQGPYYFMFVCIWIYMRHYLNLGIIASLFTDFRTVGPFELNWETEQYKCLLSQVIAFSLLALLQSLNLFWLFFILRIAYRWVVHNIAEDDRSDNEASGDEAEVDVGAKHVEPDGDEKEQEKKQKKKDAAAPEVLVNGAAVAANGAPKTNGSASKKSNGRAR